jgi:pheromone shutdown protein TraB
MMTIPRSDPGPVGKTSAEPNAEEENVHRVNLDGKSIVLIGTAHISTMSANLVRSKIEEEKPEAVCIELCP